MQRFSWTCLLCVCSLGLLSPREPVRADQPPSQVDLEFFEKKIRPLFAENCYACHGDKKQRAGLRLDTLAGLKKGGDRGPAIVPGEPDKSLLLHAVGYTDMELRMPPKGKLKPEQLADLARWIKLGAPAPTEQARAAAVTFDFAERLKHWAYQPVKRHTPPNVKDRDWPLTPVDAFILEKLEAKGLRPAPPFDRRSLIRRATFDLLGLPPMPGDVEDFVRDERPDAYARLVERLLASPHYGERWGRHWLDLVRYAETLGHEFDYDIHHAWRYRDYIVRALNSDVPYDQLVVEHLAGDLLTDPRRHPAERLNESVVGTASAWFGEGKHGPVDLRQEQAERIDNQIDVLGKAFLAQTIACARCHDHKFDAIPTQDYYALFGYFKSSRYQQAFLDPPERFDTPKRQLEAIEQKIKSTLGPAWVEEAKRMPAYMISAREHLAAEGNKRPTIAELAARQKLDADLLQRWVQALSSEQLRSPDHPMHEWSMLAMRSGPGDQPIAQRAAARRAQLVEIDRQSARRNEGGATRRFEGFDSGTPDTWYASGHAFPSRVTVEDTLLPNLRLAGRGWVHSGFLSRRLEGELRSLTFTIDQPYIHIRTLGHGGRINLVIDGFTIIRDPIYGVLSVDVNHEAPQWRTMRVEMWLNHRAHLELLDTTTPHPSIGLGPEAVAGKPGDGYLAVDEIWFSSVPQPPTLPPVQLSTRVLREPESLSIETLANRYADEVSVLARHWAQPKSGSLGESAGLSALVNWLLAEGLLDIKPATALVAAYEAAEQAIPAAARAPALADGTGEDEQVYLRGNYRTPGERAPRRLLTAVAGAKQPAPPTGSGRLELARRLANADNPLFARVIVNRLWHHHFGKGLVRTTDDFGHMGEPPTHPELLDYLATELVRQGYSLKALHRLILLSRVYQLGSEADPRAITVDADNRLWHHRPPRRLEAEAIRDTLLAVAGALNTRMEGPSIPPHLTPFMEGRGRPGAAGPLDGYGRRSIYLNLRRNFINPMFLAFDYPTPFTTIGRRSVSNVPAQALTLMNDPFVLEQARAWARQALGRAESTEQRLTWLYLRAFARPPDAAELSAALEFLSAQAGAQPTPATHLAAWTDLCHVLFNAKEFVFVR
jgi:cytochrome c553